MTKKEKIIELVDATRESLAIWNRLPGCSDPYCSICRKNRDLKIRLQKALEALDPEEKK